MAAQIQPFGTTQDGRPVQLIHLHGSGLQAAILTYGATLHDLRLAGTPWPLTLGSPALAAYEGPLRYAGAIVGPVANRIAGATAMVAGRRHHFAENEAGPITLHSGPTGAHAQVWSIDDLSDTGVTLGLDLPDGLGGFPGNRRLRACYELAAPAEMRLTLTAESDAPTLMSLAHHGYWNLDGRGDTKDHLLNILAEQYLPVGADLIPLGLTAVAGTNYDFRAPRQLAGAPPLDHNFCLATTPGALRPAATLTGARGVRLDLATTAPGLQVYDGRRFGSAQWPGLTGEPYGPHAGLALEPQLWPDAANRPDFPPINLDPGEVYRQTSVFSFSRHEMG